MTTKFEVLTEAQMEGILEVAKETGNFRDIVIGNNLKVSFIKTHENFINCGLDMFFDEGEGEGATLHFTKREIFDKDWKVNLADRLLECNHHFNDSETKLLERISKFVLKYGKAEKSGETMTLKQVLNELYFLGNGYKNSEMGEGADSLYKVTIYEVPALDNKKCLCINSGNMGDLLKDIEAEGWSVLKLKKELKNRKLSVMNQGLTYDYRIQTAEAKKHNSAMKFVVIPLDCLKDWLEEGE